MTTFGAADGPWLVTVTVSLKVEPSFADGCLLNAVARWPACAPYGGTNSASGAGGGARYSWCRSKYQQISTGNIIRAECGPVVR